MPDCFDGCPDRNCIRNGHDVMPFPDCSQQIIMDRFQEYIGSTKYPCNCCIHRISKAVCARCSRNEDS